MPSLEVQGVSKSYGVVRALRNVSFHVNSEEYFCILGPTGAGKTTLLKVIAGLLSPDKGKILIDGEDVTDLPPEDRGIAYMPQGYALFPHMTVWENVSYGSLMRNLPKDRAIHALKMVGLYHRRNSYPYELSGGQQQRVALARVIASGSKFLLLDEPLSALDLLLSIELRYELRNLAKKLGLTVIHVTHDSEEAMSIADRMLVLRRGTIQQIGTPQEIYLRPKNLFVARFLGEPTLLEGEVISRSSEGFYVDIKGLGMVFIKGIPPSRRIVLVFRPEDIEIVPNKVDSKNCFEGIVNSVEFRGCVIRLHIAAGEDVKLVSETWIEHGLGFEIGSHVWIRLPPNKALVYEYPRGGLTKAVALE